MDQIVDPTTSGPIPENVDTRPQDVVADQKAKQNDQAIGGSQPPPKVDSSANRNVSDSPLPAYQPSIPSVMDFAEDAVRSVAQQTVNDTIKKMTINGQSPTFSGSSVSFDIQVASSASATFSAQNPPPPVSTPTTPPEAATTSGGEAPKPTQGGGASTEPSEGKPPIEFGETKTTTSDNAPSDSAAAYKEAYDRSQSYKADMNDGFSPLSENRQRGEMRGEYKERMKEMEALKSDEATAEAISQGDASYFRQGFVPVLLRRKDGKRKILVQVDNTNSSVVYGAAPSERKRSIPDEAGYYTSELNNGCPFDILYEAKGPKGGGDGCPPASTESYFSAFKHTDCGEDCVGNFQYEMYSSLFANGNPEETGLYCYYGEKSDYALKLLAKPDKSDLQFFDSSSKKYLDLGISEDESFVWGYIQDAKLNFRSRVTGSDGVFETWNDESGVYAKIYINDTLGGFESRDKEGNTAKIYNAELWLNNNSESSWTQIYAGGLYMNDGSNYVDIQPPEGKDAYFQQVSVCVGGETKTAYVLMTAPE